MTNNQSVAISHSSFFSPGSLIPSSHGLDLVIPNFWGCRGKKRFTLVIPQSPWKWKSLSHVQLFATPMDYRLPGSSVQGILQARILEFASPWDLPKPGIFPTQGSNPGLPHCRWILYHLSHQGSPRILEWVAYPFSTGSSWPGNQTRVSCIASGFFTSWATREAQFIDPPQHVFKMKVKVTQSCPTLCEPQGLYSPWNSPGQNTGVGSLSLLQGIFPTQGSNSGLPHCRQILYQLSHREAQTNLNM